MIDCFYEIEEKFLKSEKFIEKKDVDLCRKEISFDVDLSLLCPSLMLKK